MSKKQNKANPGIFVKVEDCRDRHQKIEMAMFGEDGRGGMVKDIGDIKNYMESHKESGRGWKQFGYTLLSGTIIAIVVLVLSHI